MKANHYIIILFCLLFSGGANAQDTFSICAVDTATGEVGSAGASCYGNYPGCIILSDVHPGVGVIHTQAYYLPQNQNYASSLMEMGLPPQQIIDSLVLHDYLNNPTKRQYGIVDLHADTARRAAYTGINCDDYKNHIIGPTYTIQGNILLGQQILDSMEARFLNAEGELACRLMEALQGANVVGADTRCFTYGTSSLSAFLRVAQPDDPPDDLYLDLNVPSALQGVDPIDSLQSLVDIWGGCIPSDVASVSTSGAIEVFPNPAGDHLYMMIPDTYRGEEMSLQLYDTRGAGILKPVPLKEGLNSIRLDQSKGTIAFYVIRGQGKNLSSGKILLNQR